MCDPPRWQDDQVTGLQLDPDPSLVVRCVVPWGQTVIRGVDPANSPRTSKYPEPARMYRISSSSCKCLCLSPIPGLSSTTHSSKNDLIFVSYASPSPSLVTVIRSRFTVSSIPVHQPLTHVLVAPLFCKHVNRLLPLAGPINRDFLVDHAKVRQALQGDVGAGVVRFSLISPADERASAHVRELTAGRRRCKPSFRA